MLGKWFGGVRGQRLRGAVGRGTLLISTLSQRTKGRRWRGGGLKGIIYIDMTEEDDEGEEEEDDDEDEDEDDRGVA